MTTILVDILESDLVNFISLEGIGLHSFNDERLKKLFEQSPFILYKKRVYMNPDMVTIQIPLNDYILYRVHNLIK